MARTLGMTFGSPITLTHSTGLIMPNGSDMVTAVGDTAEFWSDDGWATAILVKYTMANGMVLWPSHYYGA